MAIFPEITLWSTPILEVPNGAVDVDSRAPPACYPQGNFWPMIFALPPKKHRFTRAGFPLCSGCLPRSQPGFYPCALGAISIRSKPSLCTPSLLFRGQMPHLNCPGTTVPFFERVRIKNPKGGCFIGGSSLAGTRPS